MQTRAKVVLAGVLMAGSVMAWKARTPHAVHAADSESQALVVDRIWIDHMPETQRDKVQVFVAFAQDRIGVFSQSSQWEGAHELFRFRQDGDALRVVFPQSDKKESIATAAKHCERDDGMTYCLDLGGSSHGVKHYYSQEGWDLRGVHSEAEVRTRIQSVVGSLSP